MKIEIKERNKKDNTCSFDLVVNNHIIKKDTGLCNACDYLISHYARLIKRYEKDDGGNNGN